MSPPGSNWKVLCVVTWLGILLYVVATQWVGWKREQAQSLGEIVKAVNLLHQRVETLENGNGKAQ